MMDTKEFTVKNRTKQIFILSMLIVLVADFITQMQEGQHFATIYYDYGYTHWYDFFQPYINAQTMTDSYAGEIYPPLGMLIFRILKPFMSFDYQFGDHTFARNDPAMVQLFMTITVTTAVAYAWIVSNQVRGSKPIRFLMAICSVLVFPFLFGMERGNTILFALIFLMLFAFYKDSENKVIRELSLVALALSAALKMYPAIFGLILLAEKRYKEALRCVLYGLILYLLPFAFFGGFSQIAVMVKNIAGFSGDEKLHFIYFPELLAPLRLLLLHESADTGIVLMIPTWAEVLSTWAPLLLAIIAVFVLKERWKKWFVLMLPLCSLPGISTVYTFLFMMIPLVMLMNQERIRPLNYAYLAPTCMAMLPITYSISVPTYISYYNKIEMFLTLSGYDKLCVDSTEKLSVCVFLSYLATSVLFVIVLADCILTLANNRKHPVKDIGLTPDFT